MKKVVSLLCAVTLLLSACATVHTDIPTGGGETAAPAPSDTASVPSETQGSETVAPSPSETASVPPETQGSETVAPSETESQTPAEPTAEERVRQIMANMTLREKIAQMCFIMPEALLDTDAAVTAAGEGLRAAFDAAPVGGVILMGQNLQSTSQTKALCAALQSFSESRLGLPVFIGVDEEGGDVARVSGTGKFGIDAVPRMSAVGASGDPSLARSWGATVGGYLFDLGFNVDFAPDADVLSNAANTVVRTRSFGVDGNLVAQMAGAFADGLQSAGVRACYKHFPGHGATAEDSHEGFAVSYRTADTLWENDLVPFADAVRKKIPFIMSGHISLPNFSSDGLPASLSYQVLTGLLRSEMRYNGIIITDALDMGAITQNYTAAQAAVLAVKAGNDMLLIASDVEAYIAALLEAVASGEITEARIDESVFRILSEKLVSQ